jgi:hypothetical protein
VPRRFWLQKGGPAPNLRVKTGVNDWTVSGRSTLEIVTIKRKQDSSLSQGMPAAKLYLDEIRNIVEILSTPDEGSNGSAVVVKYLLRDLECDTLEELEQLGGTTHKFEVQVARDGDYAPSALEITRRRTYLYIASRKEGERWIRYGKVKKVFESNSIAWKNVLNIWLDSLTLVLVAPIVIVGLHLLIYHLIASPTWKQREDYGYWAFLLLFFPFMWLYPFAFGGSVVLLHYSHTKGVRTWFRKHGPQVLLVVLGVGLKFLADWVWRYFQSH